MCVFGQSVIWGEVGHKTSQYLGWQVFAQKLEIILETFSLIPEIQNIFYLFSLQFIKNFNFKVQI